MPPKQKYVQKQTPGPPPIFPPSSLPPTTAPPASPPSPSSALPARGARGGSAPPAGAESSVSGAAAGAAPGPPPPDLHVVPEEGVARWTPLFGEVDAAAAAERARQSHDPQLFSVSGSENQHLILGEDSRQKQWALQDEISSILFLGVYFQGILFWAIACPQFFSKRNILALLKRICGFGFFPLSKSDLRSETLLFWCFQPIREGVFPRRFPAKQTIPSRFQEALRRSGQTSFRHFLLLLHLLFKRHTRYRRCKQKKELGAFNLNSLESHII